VPAPSQRLGAGSPPNLFKFINIGILLAGRAMPAILVSFVTSQTKDGHDPPYKTVKKIPTKAVYLIRDVTERNF
jgi:hypothetical protein